MHEEIIINGIVSMICIVVSFIAGYLCGFKDGKSKVNL